MTMPHLSNCQHSDVGWCLECVGDLWTKYENVRDFCNKLEGGAAREYRAKFERPNKIEWKYVSKEKVLDRS